MASQSSDSDEKAPGQMRDGLADAANAPADVHSAPIFTTAHQVNSTTTVSTSSISNPALEVDSIISDISSDADSAITDLRAGSSTQSARSSVYDFVVDGPTGRTFHRYEFFL
jgi:hypothetical protein